VAITGECFCGEVKYNFNGDPKIELGRHIFVGSKASWETIADDVPQYHENVPQNT
jgi:hypothetical protein